MRVLFIANPYIERSLLDFFSCISKHTFILLRANHPETAKCIENDICYMDLDEALASCDCISIWGTDNISDSLVARCRLSAKERGIPIYCIDSLERREEIKEYIDSVLASHMHEVPLVLILQAGQKTQIEKTELNLCNLFRKNHVRFAIHTNSWSPKIVEMIELLNGETSSSDETEAQLSVVSVKENILTLIENTTENIVFDFFMRLTKPDYIIMCCENDFEYCDRINDIFMIKYSRGIDTFVYSEYVSLQSNNEHEIALFIKSINNRNLFEDIKMKLTFPAGVGEIGMKL